MIAQKNRIAAFLDAQAAEAGDRLGIDAASRMVLWENAGVAHRRAGDLPAAESALEKYKGVRYLCLLITDDFKEAEFGSGTLFTIKFQPGHWKGRALYFDLEENKLIGGKQIEATNSSKIDFKTKDLKPEEQQKAARQAAEEDLRAQILQAAQNP